eukprot:809-Prorocentrum_minimum.AAC.1
MVCAQLAGAVSAMAAIGLKVDARRAEWKLSNSSRSSRSFCSGTFRCLKLQSGQSRVHVLFTSVYTPLTSVYICLTFIKALLDAYNNSIHPLKHVCSSYFGGG